MLQQNNIGRMEMKSIFIEHNTSIFAGIVAVGFSEVLDLQPGNAPLCLLAECRTFKTKRV